ncbi:MAG: CPBP family intramembrane glutamic endopeptidase [Verrucomicrobiota bacterium]
MEVTLKDLRSCAVFCFLLIAFLAFSLGLKAIDPEIASDSPLLGGSWLISLYIDFLLLTVYFSVFTSKWNSLNVEGAFPAEKSELLSNERFGVLLYLPLIFLAALGVREYLPNTWNAWTTAVERTNLPYDRWDKETLSFLRESICIVFVAPVIEELIFRYVLHYEARRRLGRWFGGLAVTAVFSFSHADVGTWMSTLDFAFFFGFGVYLWYLREAEGIISAIAFHLFFNAVAIIFAWLVVTA